MRRAGPLKLLLDTHIFIWAVGERSRLDQRTQAAVASPANQIFISAATAWEISIKHALGRLSFPLDQFDDVLRRMGFDALPIQPSHAIAAGCLPRHHDDPFDRLLIAQAQAENLTFVSTDEAIARYDVTLFGPPNG